MYSVKTMVSPQELSRQISAILPNVRCGSLRFWGDWFGRPYENGHRLIACDATDDCLRLHFNEDETLAVWNPIDVEITTDAFRIGNATALRWTWYSYGGPKEPENLRYRDYAREDERIIYRMNGDRLRGTGWLEPDATSYAAVEMPPF
jgi:hypothetical protein